MSREEGHISLAGVEEEQLQWLGQSLTSLSGKMEWQAGGKSELQSGEMAPCVQLKGQV